MMHYTLCEHGDQTEQYGAKQHNLIERFPNYEQFWRDHVVPATQRPYDATKFNHGVSPPLIRIAQRSYTVFAYLVEALDYAALVARADYGPRFRHWYNAIMYVGNAMQVFGGLQDSVEGLIQNDLGKREFKLFDDWKENWRSERENAIAFRNYVTHHGKWQIFIGENHLPYVLDRRHVQSSTSDRLTWTDSVVDFRSQPERYVELGIAASNIIDDAITWLDRAYGQIRSGLDPYLTKPNYTQLRGRSSQAKGSHFMRPATPSQTSGNVAGQSGVCTNSPPIGTATTSPAPPPLSDDQAKRNW